MKKFDYLYPCKREASFVQIYANHFSNRTTKTNDCYLQLQDGMNLLQFTPTVEDEGKFLVCRAENPKLPEAGIEDRWKLQVHCEYQMIVENSDEWLIFET